MKKWILSLVLPLLFNAGNCNDVRHADTIRNCRDSVVLIAGFKAEQLYKYGSGVVLNKDGCIITNYHVVNECDSLVVKNVHNDVFTEVSLVAIDEQRDLAVLKARGGGFSPARLGDSQSVDVGSRVFAIGNPGGYESTVSEGIISGVRQNFDDQGYSVLQTTAPVSSGSSGGGLFTDSGDLIGITCAYDTEVQNVTFAIPVHYLRPLMREVGIDNASPRKVVENADTDGECEWITDNDVPHIYMVASRRYRKIEDIKTDMRFIYDPDKWNVATETEGNYKFEFERENVAARFIINHEKMTYEEVKGLIARSFGEVVSRITHAYEQKRLVNDVEVRYLRLEGLYQGDSMVLQGYFHCSDDFFVSIYTMCSKSVYQDNKADFHDFLDGIYFLTYEDKSGDSAGSSMGIFNGKDNRFGVLYDTRIWRTASEKIHRDSALELTHANGDVYALVIYEDMDVGLNYLRSMVLHNYAEATDSFDIVREERKVINGYPMLNLVVHATVDNADVTYNGYYYSGKAGSIQFVTFALQDEFDRYGPDCSSLLEGLVVSN